MLIKSESALTNKCRSQYLKFEDIANLVVQDYDPESVMNYIKSVDRVGALSCGDIKSARGLSGSGYREPCSDSLLRVHNLFMYKRMIKAMGYPIIFKEKNLLAFQDKTFEDGDTVRVLFLDGFPPSKMLFRDLGENPPYSKSIIYRKNLSIENEPPGFLSVIYPTLDGLLTDLQTLRGYRSDFLVVDYYNLTALNANQVEDELKPYFRFLPEDFE